MIEAGVTKNNGVQLKDDNVYLLNYIKDNFQDKVMENVMDDDKDKSENVEKINFLTTGLLEIEKIIEIMKSILIKIIKSYFYSKR